MSASTDKMEKIVALCRRRGFIFGSSEIYGGIGGFWDYGPLGCELKKNIKDAWWEDMVRNPPPGPDGREFQMVGVDCSIIMHSRVWEASGHVGGFSDLMSTCKYCKKMVRSDHVWSMIEESEWYKSLVELYAAKGIDQVSDVDFVRWPRCPGAPGSTTARYRSTR